MPGLFEVVCGIFSHCTCRLSNTHHLGGCIVSEFMGVPAFTCPVIDDNCIFVEPCPVGLFVRDESGDSEFYYLSVMTKNKPGFKLPGVYVNYQPLSRDYVKSKGSYFYLDSWLQQAQTQRCEKVVIVPTDFVLDPKFVSSHGMEQFADLGFKVLGAESEVGSKFPAVAWPEEMYEA